MQYHIKQCKCNNTTQAVDVRLQWHSFAGLHTEQLCGIQQSSSIEGRERLAPLWLRL